MFADFTRDADTVKGISNSLIDHIFCAISYHRKFPELPDCIDAVIIRASTSYDFSLCLVGKKFSVLVERDVHRCIVYRTEHYTVEVLDQLSKYNYGWATITDEHSNNMYNAKPDLDCNSKEELTQRALEGAECGFIGSQLLIDELHRISCHTIVGQRYRHADTCFNLKAYWMRKFFNKIFVPKSRIVLK
jgi:hypothetical protein